MHVLSFFCHQGIKAVFKVYCAKLDNKYFIVNKCIFNHIQQSTPHWVRFPMLMHHLIGRARFIFLSVAFKMLIKCFSENNKHAKKKQIWLFAQNERTHFVIDQHNKTLWHSNKKCRPSNHHQDWFTTQFVVCCKVLSVKIMDLIVDVVLIDLYLFLCHWGRQSW